MEDRAQLESTIQNLRSKRGVAILDGSPTKDIDAALDKANSALDSVADAEHELAKRQRVEAEKRRVEKLRRVRRDLEGTKRSIVNESRNVCVAMGKVVRGLDKILKLYGDARRMQTQLNESVPAYWQDGEVKHRFAYRLARLLSSLPACMGTFGGMNLVQNASFPLGENFADSEEKTLNGGHPMTPFFSTGRRPK